MSKKKIALIAAGTYVTFNLAAAWKIGVFSRMKVMNDIAKDTGEQPPLGEYLAYLIHEERPKTWVKIKEKH